MPAIMNNTQNDHFLFLLQDLKEHCMGESTKDGPPDLAVNAGKAQRELLYAFDGALDSRQQ